MIRSLYAGVAGLRNHQVRMDVVANNIANVNTTGFKSSRANFQDNIYQLLRSGGGGRNYMQVGTGVSVGSIGNNMAQGPLQLTGRTLDLAIQGNGFFRVQDPVTEEIYYTRDGVFYIDNQGYMVNANGLRLLGDGDAPIQFAEGQVVASLAVGQDGRISITYGDGSTDERQIQLVNFANPEGLVKVGKNLYKSDTNTSGDPSDPANPGSNGMGTVESGYLEMSNVDLSEEMTNMITTQRGYQASARVITVSDTLLEELIQLKR